MKRPDIVRVVAIVLFIAIVVTSVVYTLRGDDGADLDLTLGEYLALIDDDEVAEATIRDRSNRIEGELVDGSSYSVDYPREFSDELTRALTDAEPAIDIETDNQARSLWSDLLLSLVPLLLLIAVFVLLIRMAAGRGGLFSFGKSKARRFSSDDPQVTFDDVAGAEEAVEELREVAEFLKDPSRFSALGARIPRGVLLYGPPGTGKTLLARAVAGEAGVPFFSISGSDFVEMFVGVGASRVRDLFTQATEAAPSIIFVDEIDAVGRHRGAGLGGGHDEREQTLNQLLVEMDGFAADSGVILIAATNRPDILDPALLRPGRFDRQITVDKPDLPGRRQILRVHSQGKPLAADVSLDTIARRTPGFTGADLANLLNEAALLAARDDDSAIHDDHVSRAVDRVIAGPERKSRVMSDDERRVIAYHEAGHALVGHVLTHTDPVHKVSIVARGRALGWTLVLPERDRHLRSRAELLSEMAVLLGGRTAEEIIFGDPTTGAADDIDRATKLARAMVTQYGMSDELGLRRFGHGDQEVFVGKDSVQEADYSDAVAAAIDAEVDELIAAAHAEAQAVLRHHRVTLETLAEALIERETIADVELMAILGDRGTWDTAKSRAEWSLRTPANPRTGVEKSP